MEVPGSLKCIRSRQSQKIPSVIKNSLIRKKTLNRRRSSILSFQLPDLIMTHSELYQKCTLCQRFIIKDDMGCIYSCQHLFCMSCLHSYCLYKINVMEEVLCPFDGCEQKIDIRGRVYQKLPENIKEKYERVLRWKQTLDNPDLKLCPTENCQGVIDSSKGKFKCPQCYIKFCPLCELPQHEGACDQNFQNIFQEWKRCPNCLMFIEKNQGCNHMTCICGHQFCYVCLAHWNDRHYRCREGNLINPEDQGQQGRIDQLYQPLDEEQWAAIHGRLRQNAMQIQRQQIAEVPHSFIIWAPFERRLLQKIMETMHRVPQSRINSLSLGFFMLASLPVLLFVLLSFIHMTTNVAIVVGALYQLFEFANRLDGCGKIMLLCFGPPTMGYGAVMYGLITLYCGVKTSQRIMLMILLFTRAMLRGRSTENNQEVTAMLLRV